jgi:hypothetical protein
MAHLVDGLVLDLSLRLWPLPLLPLLLLFSDDDVMLLTAVDAAD